MNRWYGVVMVRLGRMMMRVVDRLCSRGMCREDAERVLAGQGEGEGGLLCRRAVCFIGETKYQHSTLIKSLHIETPHLGRRELIKVLRLATPHLGTR